MRDITPADLCPECKIIRTARSRHCPICNKCVERFDHHCPWINNCVGVKNHNGFMLFLLAIWSKIVFHLVVDSIAFYEAYQSLECETRQCKEFCVGGFCQNFWIKQSLTIVCVIICLFYLLLSTVMLYTHCKNYMAYKTTNERLSKGVKKPKMSDASADQTESMLEESSSNFSSVLTYSDILDSTNAVKSRTAAKKSRRKGCCINMWKMCTHTKIVP